MDPIRFFEGRYYLLSNFSAHRVKYNGEEYMTAEHAFQVAKYQDPAMREKIKNAPSAFLAWKYGREKEDRVDGWEEKKRSIMKDIMRAKLLQHEDVQEWLLKTSDARIEKNHPDDDEWGTGSDGTGTNIMGEIWMELREELRRDQ